MQKQIGEERSKTIGTINKRKSTRLFDREKIADTD